MASVCSRLYTMSLNAIYTCRKAKRSYVISAVNNIRVITLARLQTRKQCPAAARKPRNAAQLFFSV